MPSSDNSKEIDCKKMRLASRSDKRENSNVNNDENSDQEEESSPEFTPVRRSRMKLINSKKVIFDMNETSQLEKLYTSFMNKKHFEETARKAFKKKPVSALKLKKRRLNEKKRLKELLERSKRVATKNYGIKASIAVAQNYLKKLKKEVFPSAPDIDLTEVWNEGLNRFKFNDRWLDPLYTPKYIPRVTSSSTSGVGSSASETLSLANTNKESNYGSGSSPPSSPTSSETTAPGSPVASTSKALDLSRSTTTEPWTSILLNKSTSPECSPTKANHIESQISKMFGQQASARSYESGPSTSSAPESPVASTSKVQPSSTTTEPWTSNLLNRSSSPEYSPTRANQIESQISKMFGQQASARFYECKPSTSNPGAPVVSTSNMLQFLSSISPECSPTKADQAFDEHIELQIAKILVQQASTPFYDCGPSTSSAPFPPAPGNSSASVRFSRDQRYYKTQNSSDSD